MQSYKHSVLKNENFLKKASLITLEAFADSRNPNHCHTWHRRRWRH